MAVNWKRVRGWVGVAALPAGVVALPAGVGALACFADAQTDGDVALATWMQATATMAAFIAAGIAAVQVSRTLKIERGRDDRDADERERRQASQVVAWWPDWQRSNPLHVTLANHSEVPVYEVEVIAELESGAIQRVKREPQLHPTPPEGWLRELKSSAVKAWLKDRYSNNRSDRHQRWVQPRVWIQFRDAQGVEWTRNVLGVLEKGRLANFDDVEHHVRGTDGVIRPASDAKPRTGGWDDRTMPVELDDESE